ncbi:MAG: hypothetical protein E7255_14755 [Lachnospiraceae bacterium]|jgi:hypothetical protein|nr:hypothetical protein [Lachnospiraceae bacterium]
MKFSDVYKNEMDNITVSEIAVNKVDTYSKKMTDTKSKGSKVKFIRTTVAAACTLILLTTVYYNRDIMQAFGQSVFGSFIFNMKGKQMQMGKIEPIKFNLDAFIADEDVNVLVDEENNKSYWRDYSCPDEMEKETGIIMVKSDLLEGSLGKEGVSILVMPNGYGHLNGQFAYGKYHVNVDGMFTYEGFKRDISGYGYGTYKDDKHDFTYEASNGITVYFLKNSNGRKLIFQAGNLLYQVTSDAPVKDLKRLIETFEFK